MKEWYLMGNTNPSVLGGFEDTYHADFKEIAFAESLDTDIGQTVVLYNYDLSQSTKIRCIIQGNSADAHLKSMERVALFIRGTAKAGMYIFFENRYWLITGYPSYNGIYEKATLQLCQYNLRWQNTNGDIVERWCNVTSASKYDIGENGNSTIVLSSDNLTLLLPDDNESLELYGKRVFIDKNKTNPTKVYKITRIDDVLYDYGEHGGVLAFIADKTELNLETDRPDLRLCDYIDPSTIKPLHPSYTDKTMTIKAYITSNGDLRVGNFRTYIVNFQDKDENILDWSALDFTWNVVSDFDVEQEIEENKIRLRVTDEELIDSSFLLQCKVKNSVIAEKVITIADYF